jgi:hypothetical protein
MMYEAYSYQGGQLVSYKSVWHTSDGELADFEDVELEEFEDDEYEFPFADLYNRELQEEYPTNYTERENHIFYRGVWYPVDSAYETEERWFQLDGQWLPCPEEGSSVFFVDETETLPFADVTDEELLSLYSPCDYGPCDYADPLDYADPWPEVYDMEYLE